MKPNLAQLALTRKKLAADLIVVRQSSMRAGNQGDFKTVGRLTMEAARLNNALSDLEAQELASL